MATFKIILNDQEKIEILTDAIETEACAYWIASLVGVDRSKDGLILSASFEAIDQKGQKEKYKIMPVHIQTGIDRLLDPKFEVANRIRKAIVTQDWDGEIYDCILQAICFAEIVYG